MLTNKNASQQDAYYPIWWPPLDVSIRRGVVSDFPPERDPLEGNPPLEKDTTTPPHSTKEHGTVIPHDQNTQNAMMFYTVDLGRTRLHMFFTE